MINYIRHICAWVVGRRVVVLEDHGGDLKTRMERRDVLGRPMAKWLNFNIRNVVLNDDGTLGNGFYVVRWHLVADYRRKVQP